MSVGSTVHILTNARIGSLQKWGQINWFTLLVRGANLFYSIRMLTLPVMLMRPTGRRSSGPVGLSHLSSSEVSFKSNCRWVCTCDGTHRTSAASLPIAVLVCELLLFASVLPNSTRTGNQIKSTCSCSLSVGWLCRLVILCWLRNLTLWLDPLWRTHINANDNNAPLWAAVNIFIWPTMSE